MPGDSTIWREMSASGSRICTREIITARVPKATLPDRRQASEGQSARATAAVGALAVHVDGAHAADLVAAVAADPEASCLSCAAEPGTTLLPLYGFQQGTATTDQRSESATSAFASFASRCHDEFDYGLRSLNEKNFD